VQTLEKCGIYTTAPVEWEAGRSYLGGAQRNVPGEVPQKILRALDIRTGKAVWEFPQKGLGNSWGGVISTATGLVFFADDSGMFVAVDGATGKPLWEFQTSQLVKASPMAYQFDGKEYIAIAAGTNILSFALPQH
jgi:alcohol dehydrogenase (cytochrome c)